MPTHEVKPTTDTSGRPRKGTMTWVGLAAILLFVVMLAFVVLRPIIARHDGPDPGVPQVVEPVVRDAGP